MGQAGRTYGSPYCKWYARRCNNLNLPDRSTVQDTYEQAIDDLKVAARLMENGETKREGPAYASRSGGHVVSYLFTSEWNLRSTQ